MSDVTKEKIEFLFGTPWPYAFDTAPEVAVRSAGSPARCECNFPDVRDKSGRYGVWNTPEGLDQIVQRTLKHLRPICHTFDCLIVTGLSGVVPGAVVAHLMYKDLLILRVQDSHGSTNSHGMLLEGDAGTREGVRYMFLDDFVSAAKTLKRVMEYCPTRGGSKLVGVCLYGHPLSTDERAQGKAKMFSIYHDGEYKAPTNYDLVRRGPKSLLFDIHRVAAVCSLDSSSSSPSA